MVLLPVLFGSGHGGGQRVNSGFLFFILRDDLAPYAYVNVNYTTYTVLSMRAGLLPSSTARGRASDLLSNHREQNPGHTEYDDLSHVSCIISRFQIRSTLVDVFPV